ncbi:hypothetical protein J1N35_020082 [Gossypium stocksii]|uniref:Uncharacterized protein n=1 Tax=Gossypium stocksii TaxID=47602 RepID=A0A9D3VC36_9ROSI|nr:hypothetical protein J1N35_020082 [Gossypium stocksii]
MAAKPLTSEAIALTEKKMDMTLDDIIKMSKTSSNKTKKQRRVLNKGQKPFNNAAKAKALKVRQYMDSRSSVRQGVLAQRRSSILGNQFPLAAEAARRAAVAPVRIKNVNGVRVANLNKPRTGLPPVQRRAKNGGFAAKPRQHQPQQQQEGNVVTKQRPHTLDSLFANMKKERMNGPAQRNGSSRQRMPWRRGRFGN